MENIINFFLRCVSAVIILSILLLAIGIMAYTWKIWAVGVGAPILSFLTYSIIFQHKYEMNKFQKIMLIILSYMEILGFISLIGTVLLGYIYWEYRYEYYLYYFRNYNCGFFWVTKS